MNRKTLIICEKPRAANLIAQALDNSESPEKYREKGVPYLIARRDDDDLIVVSALGHLFTVIQDSGSWTYPVYKYKWAPIYEADKKKTRAKTFMSIIKKLAKKVP